jgi:uncharacterized cupin superfamily protein
MPEFKDRKQANIVNINNFPYEFSDDPEFKTPMKTYQLGAAAGSEKLYINIDFVKPGASSSKYHSHSNQEEFFLIMEGSGILRFNGKNYLVQEGDCIAKPAGIGLAHQFINNGDTVLQILDCGTKAKEDVITYPDENKILIKSVCKVFDLSLAEDGWSTDPK